MRSRSVPSVLRTIAIFIASLQAARAGAVNAAEARGLGAPLYQRAVQAQAARPTPSFSRRQYSLRLAIEDPAGRQAAISVPEVHSYPAGVSSTEHRGYGASKATGQSSDIAIRLGVEGHASSVGQHRSGLLAAQQGLLALPGAPRARAPCPLSIL
jgi:hypothetical protein